MDSTTTRLAAKIDADYLAQCLINIATYLQLENDNLYVSGLQSKVDESILRFVKTFIENDDAIALVAEKNEDKIACLLARISKTAMPESGVGRVGNIILCWVEDEHRKSGLARQLVQQAETWFKQHDIEVVELSYMPQNIPAEIAWASLGYTPFRVFSYKKLDD